MALDPITSAVTGTTPLGAVPTTCTLPLGLYRVVLERDGAFAEATRWLATADTEYELGDHVRLIPGHCDPTVNLHDWFVCVRGERVESLWPVVARGALT